jgi:hypothetical protein
MANWHDSVFFGLHFDQHAGAQDTILGRDLTREHLRERLARTKPDWVQCDCKGHPGYTSWPTRVGSTSPGVVHDSLRIYRDVTRELHLPLVMHYSGVWDSRAIELHPDWAAIDAEGKASPNSTCRLSAYRDELLIPQMIELVEEYDVDGFWVDGENWASAPCWCPRCEAEFTKRSGRRAVPLKAEHAHWDEWLAFHRDLFVEHVAAYAEAVHRAKPACTVCSNWMYTVRQPDAVKAPVDYLSGDYDWIWGADRAAVEARVLDGRLASGGKLHWDLMAWGFIKTDGHTGGLPWCTKTVTHLCAEVAEVVALGGAVAIYDTPQRSGWLTDWHMDIFGEVGAFCRARREWCHQSTSRSEAAILHLADSFYAGNDPLFNYGAAGQPLEGALHALLETQHSTDILTEEGALAGLERYRLVVVPEQARVSAELRAALEAYARGGGQVLISGTHLAAEWSDLLGVTAGEALPDGLCLAADDGAVPVGGAWLAVAPKAGTEIVAYALDGQEPDHNHTEKVVVTRRAVGKGSITAVHGPIFRHYFLTHYPLLRRFLGKLVDDLAIPWTVRVSAPPRLEVIVREKAGHLVISLLNRGAAEMTMPRRVIVEELAPVTGIRVRVRTAAAPEVVHCVPETAGLAWRHEGGELIIDVPRVDIHTVLAVPGLASKEAAQP